jgi:hypothetical protein
MNETAISSDLAIYQPHAPRSVHCRLDLAALRDAWVAVCAAAANGRFTLVISSSELRLEASDELSVESVVPIFEVSGLNAGDAYHLDLAEDSFAALAVGDLPEHGSMVIDDFIAEEGFTGILRLEATFTIQCPLTLTAVGIDALTNDPVAGTPVDPRTIRTAVSAIRTFAGEDGAIGYPLSTLQIVGEEARGMSPQACLSVTSDRFKSMELRFRQSCAKPFNVLLGQLKPDRTKLIANETSFVLYDGSIRVTLPGASALPEWPVQKDEIGHIQVAAADFSDAVAIVALQSTARDAQTILQIDEMSDELTLSVAVPGGAATVSCPLLPAIRSQSARIEIPFYAQTLAMFSSPNPEALQIRISSTSMVIEQTAPHEHRKMLIAAYRPQNNYR